MIYSDLYTEVASLGFETEIESDDAFLYAVERAMRMIYTERPVFGVSEIYKPPVAASVKIKNFLHGGGRCDTVAFNSRSYSFKTSGVGSFRITDEAGEENFSFSGEAQLHRGFVHGRGKIEFLGEYAYSVYDFSFFDEIFGPSEEDIPYTDGFVEYDAAKYTENFSSFTSVPKDENGNVIKDAVAFAGKIRIPSAYCGKVRIEYKKAPCKLSGSPEEELLLPDGCEHLLPLLVAAYIWLDDDAEKAQYYMSLYREAMAAVKFYDRTFADSTYRSVNGWA